ncbi:MAG: dihydroorotate dehydrogenase [Syntrophomonadaceae bacterium]|nr:dihydroorotate dehydrogenase [Syntrophomonadaceae bacterium]
MPDRKKKEKERPAVNLAVDLGGIPLRNPVTVASGTFGYGREYEEFVDLKRLGAVIVKGTTLEPRAGNPPPRIVETPAGMLNAIGLENPGVEAFVSEHLPYLAGRGVTIIANIAGDTVEEYAALAARLDGQPDLAGIEVNISCPNVKRGGMQFGTDPGMVREVVTAVRENTGKPLVVKLSPNVTDIVQMARVAVEAGADALSLINTLLGMAIDVEKQRPVLANVFGGLSGPAIKPVAVRMVYQVAREVDVPILGMGGIMSLGDVLEFLLAGATAVSVGTGNFVEPHLSQRLVGELESYLEARGIADVRELVGAAWGRNGR